MEELRADTSTDLLLMYALQRRALAFDQCNLITYDVLHGWTQVMIAAYLKPLPEGYRPISLEQLHYADLELFKRMMEENPSNIRPTLAGVRPLDESLNTLIKSPEVRLYLQPLQGSASASSGRNSPGQSSRGGGRSARRMPVRVS